MIKIGIVGLPNVGKSTLFSQLTKKQVTIANYPFATIDPNIGVVEVPDERLDKLAEFSQSARKIQAVIEFADIAGLVKGASQGQGLGNEFLTHIRDVDAILHLVRVFEDPEIVHVEEKPDPPRDFETVMLELVLKDLEVTSRALDKAESETKSGHKDKIKRRDSLRKIKSVLEEGKPLRQGADSSDELTLAKEIGLLTQKPVLVVFNISEKQLSQKWEPVADLKRALGGFVWLAIPIGLEHQIAESGTPGEKKELYQIAGIEEAGLNALVKKSYETLGLITFFTTGSDETRAWTIPAGAAAPRAGRAIHSDFEEKFIRAEVISWHKLLGAGSWAKAQELGLLKTAGKDYLVQDGDVVEFKI